MADEDSPVFDIAAAVSDGRRVDWEAAQSSASSDGERAVLEGLRLVADLDALNRSETSGPPCEPESPRTAHANSTTGMWGPLHLFERIGAGRFGEVYRAWDPRLDREVALKLLVARPGVVPAVVEEARLLARVRSPSVITVYGADDIEGRVGICMELVRGTTLAESAAQHGPFDAREVAAIGVDLCGALEAVHAAGLLHRDVKPQNVMREPGGRIVLMDFGAGAEQWSPRATCGVAGTPLYLAPELFEGGPATVRSDVYSLGVLLYFLVAGTHPVTGNTPEALREHHAAGVRRPLRDARPDLPGPFIEALERALDTDPSRRYDSARAFGAVLAATLQADLAAAGVKARRSRRRAVGIGALIAAVLLTTGMAAVWRFDAWPLRRAVALNLEPRDWVLLTAFENRTGEPPLDGTIEAALERELANSRFVNVAPRVRVEDTLQLMGRSPDTRVDRTIGREIALRDGGIRVMLAGRIEKLGPEYVISATLVEPGRGVALASVSEGAPSPVHLSRALRRLSNRVREALGEASQRVRQDTSQLEKVTTPSLQALRLYSESYRLGDRNQWPAALAVAREAVRRDPQFAAAHIWLAWALRNTGAPPSEVESAARQAMQLADRATESERYWITGSYHSLRREYDKAASAYEALTRLQPNHRWAVSNLLFAYLRLGKADEAEALAVRRADLRPTSVPVNYGLAVELAGNRKLDAARRYFARVRDLTSGPDLSSADLWPGAYVRLVPAYEAWFKADALSAAAILDRIVADPAALPPRLRDDVWRQIVPFYISMGRVAAARRAAALILENEERHLQLAHVAWAAGHTAALRSEIRQVPVSRKYLGQIITTGTGSSTAFQLGVWLKIEAGLLDDAGTLIQDGQGRPTAPRGFPSLAGQLALARGDPSRARALLRSEVETPPAGFEGSAPFFRAAEALAATYVRTRQPGRAAEVLRAALARRRTALWGGLVTHVSWMRLQLQLAEHYRRLGREAEARPLEEELTVLLAAADPDFSLLRRLYRLKGPALP